MNKENYSFENLSEEECLEVYLKVFENAKLLFNIGRQCALQSNFGLATSFTILGAEEYLKGVVLYLRGKGVNVFAKKELRGVLSNHRNRHEFASLVELLRLIISIASIKIPTEAVAQFRQSNSAFMTVAKELIDKLLLPSHSVNTNIQWWEKANDLKNRGIYVDFKGQLLLPSSITQQEFEASERAVTDLKETFRSIQKKFESLSPEKLKVFISDLNEAIKLTLRK